MKKNNFFWMMAILFIGQAINAQVTKNNFTDPAAQIKQLTQLPAIHLPAIQMPAITTIKKDLTPGYNIKKTIEKGKMNCALLKYQPAIELEGERNSNENVSLEWKTTHNSQGLYFDIERSLKDTLHFEKVNSAWSKKGGGNEKYQLPDKNDFSEISYYRVKWMQHDGKVVFSNKISIKGFDNSYFTVYPNPVSSRFQINLSSKETGNAAVAIYNGKGDKVLQYSLLLDSGFNTRVFNITNLSAGVYTVKVILPDKQLRIIQIIKN